MSMTFYIKPKTSWLKKHKVLSLQAALNLSSNSLNEFTYCSTEEDWNEHAHKPLSEFDSLRIANIGHSARGFELYYDKQDSLYGVRVNTPSSIEDWELALQYIQELSLYLKGSITNEENTAFSNESIVNFDFYPDINAGLQSITNLIEEEDHTELTIFGYNRPVVFDKDMVIKINTAQIPAQAFSDIVRSIQNIDAYNANPIGLENDASELCIAYVIGENVPTIIPVDPSYNINPDIKEDVVKYIASLCYTEDDLENNEPEFITKEIDYKQFIDSLSLEQYTRIDGMHILIHPLSKEQIKSLAF